MMIAVNELTEQKCHSKEVLDQLAILLSPYAPHLAEELWQIAGNTTSVMDQSWPVARQEFLEDDTFSYPVSFNGKMRFNIDLSVQLSAADVEKAVLAHEKTAHYLEGYSPKKIIVVPKRIVNIVM
jgi:leucyl-tRNA synthetase